MDGSSLILDRRRALVLAGAGVLGSLVRTARADTLPHAVVYRDPTCGCCHKWVEHLEAHGFATSVRDMASMRSVKARFGVPPGLASCHTAEIGGYVIEGHVPASAIKRLLQEKPEARGLAVPGMPIGSPGMEGPDPEVYDVFLFGDGEPRSFGRYLEDEPV
jgi:hypothetical protein